MYTLVAVSGIKCCIIKMISEKVQRLGSHGLTAGFCPYRCARYEVVLQGSVDELLCIVGL